MIAVVLGAPVASAAIAEGEEMPELPQYGLSGELPELAGKVVLVDIWASWCAPCKASFPAFTGLQKELANAGFVMLAVRVDRKASGDERFLKTQAPGFATVHDGSQKLVAMLEPPAMPTGYLFGRDGRLRAVHAGFHGDRTIEELCAEILPLLKETTS
ncbi:MAG: TlpA family protein disulfide reductase [Candidatus Synoicihabitans palmerolidicus]|nr:TlpA family protein disulfide reductase [Candidatus Synoicihabitans palmerolidicus]